MTPRASTQRLLLRLKDRTDVDRERALAQLGSGLPLPDVTELADLLEIELGIPIGLLRGDDCLDVLLAPFLLGNPFTWLWAEAALEDGLSEINHRLKRRGVARDRAPQTVHELFEAWCGQPAA
jgi:hypothetical protein